ncbi:MAG: helix-turn-helix domain-containing protein [Actinobacteria bacterium]|nr:helix-turn-helix domain-containing protein [Actinomycetota bacterium]
MREALTVTEAVSKTTLSRATLYRLMREGRIEFTQIGRRRIIFADSIEALFADSAGGCR